MRKALVTTLFCLLAAMAFSQGVKQPDEAGKTYQKGDFYAYWGWNWDAYSRSDIHFTGRNYDFTLGKVRAQDRPTPFSIKDYFSPVNLTIPQCNARIGYYIRDNYNLSVGWDHMKYVVAQGQVVDITGVIDSSSTPYDGAYDHDAIQVKPGFLKYEHTDGLNVANVELRRIDPLFTSPRLGVHVTEGIGVGMLFPRTDARLLAMERRDEVHLAGFELGANAGLNVTLFKHFFVQGEYKLGWIDLPGVRTTPSKSDHASQNFGYGEAIVVLGGKWNLGGK